MDCLRIYILFYAYVYANGLGASPTLTLPNPIYYVDQSIAVSCGADLTPEFMSINITIYYDGFKKDLKCELYDVGWNPSGQGISADCGNLPTSGRVNLTITTQLVEEMKFATVTCTLGYFDKGSKTISNTRRNAFSDAYVAPRGLEFDLFEFDGGKLVLNNTMRSRCKSQGGFPSSNYTYEVVSRSGALVYSITELKDGVAEFVINDSLKNGFKVTCRDRIHTRGEISLTKQDCGGTGSELCLPHYIASKAPHSQTVWLNPNYINRLGCDVEGYPTDQITYSWTIDGKTVQSGASYILTADINKDGLTENLTCKASLDTFGSVTIAWTIVWSLQATTTTAPGSASTAIRVGVGVGIAVIIIAVVIGIALYKKKKDNSKRYQNTASDPPSLTVDKHEKPAENSSTQANNGGYPPYA